jgi:hypothetical protein
MSQKKRLRGIRERKVSRAEKEKIIGVDITQTKPARQITI